MTTVRYLYSACVVIETADCRVLCDPWFHAAYEGAWAQWPRIEKPVETCGPADYVFISHVHPDHYDPSFLNEYLERYPKAKVLIAQQTPALLERKLRSRGIEPLVGSFRVGATSLATFQNGNRFDSALVVTDGRHAVANLNDNPYDQAQLDTITRFCGHGLTVALLPFVGAGPWPQCYDGIDQAEAAEEKRRKYLDTFARYCQALGQPVAVPFAGQYWLHGPQLDLNPLRGMADATECLTLNPNPPYETPMVWVPADGGQSTLTVEANGTVWWDSERTAPYDWPTVRKELAKADDNAMLAGDSSYDPLYRYEREIQVPVGRLPLLKLFQSAVENASPEFQKRAGGSLYLCIKTAQSQRWLTSFTASPVVSEMAAVEHLTPRVEVTLDARLLFGMLTRLYNANSCRIGSLCRFKVVPAEPFNKDLDDLFGEYWDSLRV